MSDKTHICINCGAQINTSDTRCPYCGYINEEGAEKAYMNHLYDIRDNLDTVDEKAATEYGRGYGKVFKLILITLAVLLVISGIVYAIRLTEKSKRRVTDQSRGSDMLDEMTWKKETYAKLDSLYDQGKYDEMCKVIYEANEQHHSIYEWEHYPFASAYDDYIMTLDDLEHVDEEGWKEYEAGAIFYRCCFIYYRDDVYKYGDPDNKLTEEETEKLKPVIGYMEGVLHERLGFTDEEMDQLKNRLVGDNNNLLYDECIDISKQRMERFK